MRLKEGAIGWMTGSRHDMIVSDFANKTLLCCVCVCVSVCVCVFVCLTIYELDPGLSYRPWPKGETFLERRRRDMAKEETRKERQAKGETFLERRVISRPSPPSLVSHILK
jgi:hypothetical protein